VNNSEDIVQLAVITYLKLQYPQVRFMANYLSGARLPIYLAKKAKRLGQAGQGTPDLFIFYKNDKYSMLVLELKADNSNPYKLNGMLKTNEHLEKQSKYLTYLNKQGAYASFATGVSEAISLIDKYMSNEL
jgi:rhamnose utilization protein RhaD (predicted bifunctional aldolase and dehydrogenase)